MAKSGQEREAGGTMVFRKKRKQGGLNTYKEGVTIGAVQNTM